MARHAWNRGMEPNRIVLEHIRALLLALAVLVDRAAGLPAARRLHLLAVLGHGEAEARCLIVAMASDRCPGGSAGTSASHSVAGDAALLAARFRMLALAVDAMLAQTGAEPSCRRAAPPLGLPGHKPRGAAQTTPSPDLRATSPPLDGGEESGNVGDDVHPANGPKALRSLLALPVAIGAPLSGQRERWHARRDGEGKATAMRIERPMDRFPPLPNGERVAAKRPGEGAVLPNWRSGEKP